MSLRTISQTIFWQLPYDFRKIIFPVTSPTRYKKFKHKMERVDESGYSFTSFYHKKMIFVHIPKCAGNSISQSICGNLGGGHIPAKNYQLIMPKSDFENFFKFSFVRNPWDRLYSAYEFLKAGGMNKSDLLFAKKNIFPFADFEDFVMNWLSEKNIQNALHFLPQYKFICDSKGKVLLDFIGRFENIEDDYWHVCEQLNIGKRPLLFLNKTDGKKDYKKQYNLKMLQKVERVYQKDIELLNYYFHQ